MVNSFVIKIGVLHWAVSQCFDQVFSRMYNVLGSIQHDLACVLTHVCSLSTQRGELEDCRFKVIF